MLGGGLKKKTETRSLQVLIVARKRRQEISAEVEWVFPPHELTVLRRCFFTTQHGPLRFAESRPAGRVIGQAAPGVVRFQHRSPITSN